MNTMSPSGWGYKRSLRWIRRLGRCLALFGLFASIVSAQEQRYVRVTGQRVNLRALPSRDAAVLFRVEQGETLILLEDKGDWLFVEGPGSQRGYLHRTLAEASATSTAHPNEAAESPGGAAGDKAFGNTDVISLVKAKLSETLVVAKIQQASAVNFDLSTDGLIALKKAGVSDTILEAMLKRDQAAGSQAASTPGNTTPASPSSHDPDDPLSPHEGGIYYLDESGEGPKLAMLEPTVYKQAKSGGFFKSALTYGIAKIKTKAVLTGAHAQFQIANRNPTFYFYFEVASAGLSGSGLGYFSVATSANEFVLAKPEVKKSSRELLVGEASIFGAQGGALDKSVVEFEFEKLAPGIYKVFPKAELEPGEYCFFYGGTTAVTLYGAAGTAGGKVFDFGVRAND